MNFPVLKVILIPILLLQVHIDFIGGERIVEDEAEILKGVPVDYSYNETSSSNGLSSVPGCPKSIEGYPWIQYKNGDTAKCFLVGDRGPCPIPTSLHMRSSSEFGFCAFHARKCEPEGTKREPRPANSRYTFCIEREHLCDEHVYDNKENKVYHLYSQGPCPSPDQWIQPDPEKGIKCAPSICPNGSRLIDKTSDEKARIPNENGTLPCCNPVAGVSDFIQGNVCPEGQYYSQRLKRCQPRVENSDFIIG